MTMSYTRECNSEDCSAMLTWNDTDKRYEDQLFPGQKHDHKKYMTALALRGEASNEGKIQGNIDTKNSIPTTEKIEGTECKTCKSNGFDNVIIFFRNDVLSKNNKKIPLEYAEQINGQYIGHEHKTKDNPNPVNKPIGLTPTPTGEAKQSAVTKPQDDNVSQGGMSMDNFQDTLRAWTYEMRNNNAWFAEMKPKIEAIVGWMLANAVKPADQTKSN